MEAEIQPEEPDPSPVTRGRRLGRYVLCYELASGGMATVYLARAEGMGGFGKLAALKVIHPHLAKQKDFVEMFFDEARIAARIVHPNVCSVFDFGEEAGTHYLAMDYLVGENAGRLLRTLAKRPEIAERPEVPLCLARIVADACEGLHAAHEAKDDDGSPLQLVHRDVTPQNLFVGYDGSVRVVDFGVATAVGRSHHTTAGTLKGKFPYMSPEQIAQQPIDRRSDVWSLGVCLWELLVRKRLFARGSEFNTLRAIAEEPIPAPSEIAPYAPAVFDAVVLKALERDREKRYPTARALARDLNEAIRTMGTAGAPELAELMDALFAAVRAERAALIEKARKVDPEAPSTSKIAPAPTGFYDTRPSGSLPPPPFPPERRSKVPWIAGGGIGALALAAIAVGVVWSMRPEQDAAPETAELAREVAAEDSVEPQVQPPPSEPPRAEELPEPVAVAEPVVEPPPPIALPRAGGGERRREREAPPPPRPAGNGTVNVVTPPGWAEIFVGGRRVGRSPTEVRLPAGRQTIRLVPYGDGPPIDRTVDVEPDAVTRLVVRIEAPPE